MLNNYKSDYNKTLNENYIGRVVNKKKFRLMRLFALIHLHKITDFGRLEHFYADKLRG